MAISQAVAQAILGQRTPDIMGAFEQGQETALKRQERDRQEKIRELSGMALQGDDESMKELTGIAPELSLRMQEAIGAQDDAALARFIKDAKVGESLLIDGNVQGFLSFADQRIKAIKRMGGDTAQTERIAALVRAGDTDTAIQELTAFSSAIDQAKQITDTPRQREFAQFAAMPEGTEAERTEKRQFGQAIGAIAKTPERLTPEQFKAEEEAKAVGKALGKGSEERQQIAIDRGVEAADATANLRRTLSLLDEIKTGGLAAANLKAKRLLGIEGASEGELSNALGTAVLSQLKATFGSAFTAQEGERLEKLSAGFGKSPEANRRILTQSLRIAEKSARRGIRAAEARKDDEAATQIREAMEFSLDFPEESVQKKKPQGVTFLGFE